MTGTGKEANLVKLIIFDWDDVFVIGAIQGYYACYRKALSDYDVHLNETALERIVTRMWGQPHQFILKELLGKKIENVNLAEVVKKYKEYKKSDVFLSQLKLVNGGRDFIIRMSETYTLALATSQQRTLLLETLFPMYSIPNVFKEIISSHDLEDPAKAKPHPYMIKLLLKKLQIEANQTVMVGDATNDVIMAQNAGVEPIVVLTGHLSKNEAEKLGVRYIIPDVTKLPAVLDKLL